MMTFRALDLGKLERPPGITWLLEKLESSRNQALHQKRSKRLFKSLQETALLESTECSNRIDGVTVEPERLGPLIFGAERPCDRSEEEILGYRNALFWIHENHGKASIDPETIKQLHALAQAGTVGDAGAWKESQNEIVELDPEGRLEVRFEPVEPALVPAAIEELCFGYNRSIDQSKITPLVAAASLVFDFLCIHPFREANGRVSRLLTSLVLCQLGHNVGRYISLERIIEQTRASYYKALQTSSVDWHAANHDILPWLQYFLSTIHTAYGELEASAGR